MFNKVSKKGYKYFVSYLCNKDGKVMFADCCLTSAKKIDDIDGVLSIRATVANNLNCSKDEVIIINYKLIK